MERLPWLEEPMGRRRAGLNRVGVSDPTLDRRGDGDGEESAKPMW